MRQSRCWVSVLSLVLAVGSGCHTMRFELVDEPAGEVVREHKSYFLWGLAPTVEVDVLNKCPVGAVAIRERTGLNVDLVRGSSPQTVPLELELGGSPYHATEVWTKKGVVIAFDRAVTLQTVALLVVSASLGAMLTMQTGFTAVRRRRRELGMLRAIGWSAFDSFRLVLYELAILGGLAALASVVALLIARQLGLQLPNYVLAGPAIGLAAALAGGLLPAAVAARTSPAEAITHVRWSGRSRLRSSSRLLLGARDMLRAFRVEAASSAILVCAGSLTVAG